MFSGTSDEGPSLNSWYIDDEAESTKPSGSRRLSVTWGSDEDDENPITCVRKRTVSFTLHPPAGSSTSNPADALHWEEVVHARAISLPEVELLACKCNGFEMVDVHGEMDDGKNSCFTMK